MREVKFVVATVSNPTGADDLGTVAEAHYFVEDGVVRLCEPDGRALGEPYRRRLEKGEHERDVARRLALRLHRSNYPDDGGFHRPTGSLRYSWVCPC